MKPLNKNNLIFLLPVLSGLLLFLAYPPQKLGFLVFIALIPLFYFLNQESTSQKKAFFGGLITGIIFLGGLFVWLLKTAPFDWLGITSGKGYTLVLILLIILWVIQILFLSLFFAVFPWIYKKLVNLQLTTFAFLIVVPSLWVIIEYLRTWGFSVLWLGKETLFGSHWTFGNLAYALHNNTVSIQAADIGGIYLISFLIVLINIILFTIFKVFKKQNKSQIIALIIILVLIISFWRGYGIYKLNSKEKGELRKIALLQTNFPSSSAANPYQKEEIFRAVLSLFQTKNVVQENPDFIIAPEGFGLVSLTKSKEITKYLIRDFWKPGQIFLENERVVDENGKNKSRLFYYDLEKEKPIAFQDKMLLVPNGDYLPYLTKFLLGIYSFNVRFEEKLFQKGEKNDIAQTPKANIGSGICSSILSPALNRELTQKGAQILVVVSSDAPFHGSKALLSQNLAMSQLRAVENRRYFVQATNAGYSFLLDSKGQIIVKSSEFGNKIFFSDARLNDKKTLYTKFGDWPACLSFLTLLVFIVIHKRRKG